MSTLRRLAAPFDDHPRTEALRLRARSRERLFRCAGSPVRRRARRTSGSSGPPDANEAGENRASRRASHFGDRTILTRWRCLPPCEIENRPPLTPLSPPPNPRPARSLFFELTQAGRRPPRPVPRAPRERRALLRSGMSSTDRRDAHPARAEARTRLRGLHPRRGAHVMRIAVFMWVECDLESDVWEGESGTWTPGAGRSRDGSLCRTVHPRRLSLRKAREREGIVDSLWERIALI
jgi:hypothetical protein